MTTSSQDWLTQSFLPIWLPNLAVLLGALLVTLLVWQGKHSERWAVAWRRLRSDRLGRFAGVIAALFLVVGALETVVYPTDTGSRTVLQLLLSGIPQEKGYSAPLATHALSVSDPKPLLKRHLLGTDALGRDTLVQTLRATRSALWIGGLTSLVYIPLGVLLGILAAYYRGWVDDVVQYLYSTIAAVPEILMLVAILMVLGKGLGTMAIALGITGWVGMARLIRGEALRQMERPYVAAAKALGQSDWRILTRHLLPNVMHLIVIKFVLGFSGLVLAEAVLSYLGVGAPVGTPSWGAIIDASRSELSRDPLVWWNLAAASTALFLLVLSLNILGDALRRAFDPKSNS
jgi:peptide/nickel transport system permease protein